MHMDLHTELLIEILFVSKKIRKIAYMSINNGLVKINYGSLNARIYSH